MTKEKRGEDHEELKKAYAKVRKKYKLIPTFEELDKEFEITLIDPDRIHFLIRDINRAINSRLHKCVDSILPIINPHPSSLHSMMETKFFEKQNTAKLFEFYKKIMYLIHKSILSSVKSEKDEANFINEVWKEWPKIKSEMIEYLTKITEGWAKTEKEENREDYLG